MRSTPTVIAKLRTAHPTMTWSLYLPDQDRWLDFLFRREREAQQFAKRLMQASSAA